MPYRLALLTGVTLGLGLAATGCSDDPAALEGQDSARILFIGNSLTYTNDLPGMVDVLLGDGLGGTVHVASAAFPNYGLQDHWVTPLTREALESGGPWDVVVLQQGPSATEGRPSLIEYSELFAPLIRAAGGRPALYMVWPSSARIFDFDGVSDSYWTAARTVDGLLFPAGDAWRAAWRLDPNLPLYGGDGFHPSRLGTYLAALVIVRTLLGPDAPKPPAAIPVGGQLVDIDTSTADLLWRAAVEAVDAVEAG